MRRLLLLFLLTAGLAIPAACGNGDDVAPFAFPTVSDPRPGTDAEIVSSTAAPEQTEIQVLTEGTGRAVAAGDILVTDLKSQVWSSDGAAPKPYVNTFAAERVLIRPLEQVVPAWTRALPGVKVGSRVLLVAPPVDAFGERGNSGAGIAPEDSVLFLIDILDAIRPDSFATGKPVKIADTALPTVGRGADPTIRVAKAQPPKGLVDLVLQKGTGATVAEGQTIVAQYTGVIWRDGTEFDTSWKPGRGPFAARIAETDPRTGEPGVIKGWVQGLRGKKVGDRVLLVIPPKLGYGPSGNAGAGIKGTDTLVFVVDILGVYNKPA